MAHATASLACDPVLMWESKLCGRECNPVTEFGEPAEKLRQRLLKSMVYYDGVGLAAPQIGLFVQAAIMRPGGVEKFVANPKILSASGSGKDREGCLSLPGCSERGTRGPNLAWLDRPQEIVVEYWDVHGERHQEDLRGFDARVFMHETDHLVGTFFIDHCSRVYRSLVLRRFWAMKRFYAKNIADHTSP